MNSSQAVTNETENFFLVNLLFLFSIKNTIIDKTQEIFIYKKRHAEITVPSLKW